MASVLDREAIVAPKTFNRWLIPAAALAIHLCIGQVYAFSVFKIPLMSRFDVGEVSVGWIFSVAIAMLGLSAAFGGTWVEKAGPRKSMVVAGTAWVLGFIAALGIHRPVVAGLLWLRFHRRYRIGHRLYFSGINPHEMVPRPPWTSYRVSDHGFWWRCTDCQPVISSANEVIWWRYRNRGSCHRFGAHFYYTGNQLRRDYCRRSICDRVPHADWVPVGWIRLGNTGPGCGLI